MLWCLITGYRLFVCTRARVPLCVCVRVPARELFIRVARPQMEAVAARRGWQLHADWSALTFVARNEIPAAVEQYVVSTAQMDSQLFCFGGGGAELKHC